MIWSLNFVDRKILHSLTLLHSERPKLHTILAFLSAIGSNGVSLQHPFQYDSNTYICMHASIHVLLSYPYRKLRKRHKDATNDSAKRSKEVKSPSEFSLPDLDGSSETRKPEIGKGYICLHLLFQILTH